MGHSQSEESGTVLMGAQADSVLSQIPGVVAAVRTN